jgi:hypothetical protein
MPKRRIFLTCKQCCGDGAASFWCMAGVVPRDAAPAPWTLMCLKHEISNNATITQTLDHV